MDLLFFILSIWFGIWFFRNMLSSSTDNIVEDEDKEINLFMEKVEQNGHTTYLAWREDNNSFVCQAPTEKELHTKLFEIFKGDGINMRVDEDTIMKLRFEVFEKPAQ